MLVLRKSGRPHHGVVHLVLLLGLVGAFQSETASAQQYDLYAGLIKSKGYVVGSPLSQSGFHRWNGDTTWTHIGWNHPHVSAVSILPSRPNVVFLAAANGAMRSLDGGKSWKIVTGWQVTELQDVKINPSNPSEIVIAGAYGIWRSQDGGDSWTDVSDGLKKRFVQRLVYDNSDSNRILAGTDGGVYVSENHSAWRPLSEDVPVLDLEQSASDASVWIAGTRGKGVMLSSDGGRTWTYAKGRRVAGMNVYGATVDPANAKHLAAAGWKTGVLISNNGGRSWSKRTRGLPTDSFYQVEFDPGHNGRLWAATIEQGIYYTDDDGKTWTDAGMYGTLVFDLEFVRKEGAK